MVLYPYLVRNRLFRERWPKVARAFSLLELVLVLFVLGVLAASLAPSVRGTIEKTRTEAERRLLGDIATTITASFEATDLSYLNVAALPGTIGPGDVPTRFSTTTTAPYAATAGDEWFAKVGRQMGITPLSGPPPSYTAQPELARIAENELGNPRFLFAGPTETGRQRFLLVSLMARTDQLVLPAFEANAAWFDAIWEHNWENRAAPLPAYWTSRLTPAQAAAWTAGSGGTTQVWKVCVQRILLPKFRVIVNNNHPSEAAFVSFNNTPNAFTAAANTGASTTPEILGGRLVIINRGTSWPGVEALRFTLKENPTVTLQ
jgi:type II secretory pathway pseudopilin PulG